ncbi:VOC family protein [Arthrobacter sp. YAF34]|uniref:VOC family protein n=1 Tax=Arthrobacter sp. YAF34 TaxID=3233083 RepID=UPI003F928CB9
MAAAPMAPVPKAPASLGSLHHVELWVPDLPRAKAQWGWLLGRLGYESYQDWDHGCSWRQGPTYIVVEQSPALSGAVHERTVPGLNHLAFNAGTREQLDTLAGDAPHHGWTELFPETYPHAGGPGHFAAYLVNSDGYEVELIAAD